ncbi:MAG: sialidase, partial [Candidatus Acidiferrales bacterium]
LLAPPGTYTVKLMAGGKEYSQKLKVLKDPHSSGTEGDIQTQTKLVTELQDELNTMADTVNEIESARAQLNQLAAQLGGDENSKSIRTAADDLGNKLVGLEGHLLQLKASGRGQDDVRWESMLIEKLDYLARQLSGSDFPPTTQQVAVSDELKKQVAQYRNEAQQLMSKDVAAFNSMLRTRNVANIIVKTP